MGRLLYSMIASVDGYVADADGHFDSWARPDEEALEAVNEDMAEVGTYLYGRRMYQMMAVWETDPSVASQSLQSEVFAQHWRAAEKLVYSTTLGQVSTRHTSLHRRFDPDAVRALKESAAHDLTVDGPTLAAAALRHGLVDEVHMLICPIMIGGGLRMLPELKVPLRLMTQRRFGNGTVQLKYSISR